MKRLLIAVCLAIAGSAQAQQHFEPATPRALSDSQVQPSGTLDAPAASPSSAEAPPPQLVMNAMRHEKDADARQCLQLATNAQVHRCAERYRSHKHAAVAKTARKQKAKPAEQQISAKAGDSSKAPAAGKSADANKSGAAQKSAEAKGAASSAPVAVPTRAPTPGKSGDAAKAAK